jgi:hypothetical protein
MSNQRVMTADSHVQAGDSILVDPCCVGEELYRGVIVEIRTDPSPEHYLVRWGDGRESVFFPSRWSHVVHPDDDEHHSGASASPAVSSNSD